MGTPIAFFVFNRPAQTATVIARIRDARPDRLYVIADGPRPDRPGEAERCAKVRDLVEAAIDWPCEVVRDYSAVNLGCGRRLQTGIDAVFSQEEEAIFLEDDCLPQPAFFAFCSELLARYRTDARVAQICGTPLISPEIPGSGSDYLFSRYGPVWGWASWRRAWKRNDPGLAAWREPRAARDWRRYALTRREARVRAGWYDAIVAGALDTWDLQWGLAKRLSHLLSIIPATNLVRNIGAGLDSTHPTEAPPQDFGRELTFPLQHPPEVVPNDRYDRAFSQHVAPTGWRRLRRAWERRRRQRAASSPGAQGRG